MQTNILTENKSLSRSIHVTLVVWTARAGKARSVSAAASRPRGLERQFSLGVWREHTHSDICDTDCS